MPRHLTRRALREELPRWGILVLESHHAPAFTMEWRTHTFLKIIYVFKGGGELHFMERKTRFSAADVMVIPPGTPNRIVDLPDEAVSLYVCCIDMAHLKFDSRLPTRLPIGLAPPGGHFANRVASLMRRMAYAQSEAGVTRSIEMVADALRLVLTIVRHSRARAVKRDAEQSPERIAVAEYVDHLRDNFFEADTIDAAADGLGMSRRTFTRYFREHTGESWLRFVRRLAIEHAKRRLCSTDLPVISVAFECGFNDLSTFYRQFRSHCGMSPVQFREQSGVQFRAQSDATVSRPGGR